MIIPTKAIFFWSGAMKFHRLINAHADWLLLQQSPNALDEPIAYYQLFAQLLPNTKNYEDYSVCLSIARISVSIWRTQLPELSRQQLETLRETLSQPIDFLAPLPHVAWAEYCDLAREDEQATRLEFVKVRRYRMLYQPRNTLNRYGDFIHALSESLTRQDFTQAKIVIDNFEQSLAGFPIYNYPGVIMLREQTITFDTILASAVNFNNERADLLAAIDKRLAELEEDKD